MEEQPFLIIDTAILGDLIDCFGLYAELLDWLSHAPVCVEKQEVQQRLDHAASTLSQCIERILYSNRPDFAQLDTPLWDALQSIKSKVAAGEITRQDAANLADQAYQDWLQLLRAKETGH